MAEPYTSQHERFKEGFFYSFQYSNQCLLNEGVTFAFVRHSCFDSLYYQPLSLLTSQHSQKYTRFSIGMDIRMLLVYGRGGPPLLSRGMGNMATRAIPEAVLQPPPEWNCVPPPMCHPINTIILTMGKNSCYRPRQPLTYVPFHVKPARQDINSSKA